MFSPSQFSLVPLSLELGDLLFRWRNAPHVREMMFNTQPIALPEHTQWLVRVLDDESARYRVLFLDSVPVGLVNFTEISAARASCNWGFYLGEQNLPQGTGAALAYYGLNHAFGEFPFIQEIIGKVLGRNARSIAFHQRLGFVEITRTDATRNQQVETNISFALSRETWRRMSKPLAKWLFGSAC